MSEWCRFTWCSVAQQRRVRCLLDAGHGDRHRNLAAWVRVGSERAAEEGEWLPPDPTY